MTILQEIANEINAEMEAKAAEEAAKNQFDVEDSLEDSPRKLAILTKIEELLPIEGADRIEVARFTANSWQCIVGKGEFKVGDWAVFFEVDSFLPKEERYAILEGRCNKVMKGKEGYRLKSMKMKGQISQGFAMPVRCFPEVGAIDVTKDDGADVTKTLGVKLWQMPLIGSAFGFNIGRPQGNFPTHLVPKTDQERVQNYKGKLMNWFGDGFEITEKLDGTSCTMIMHRKKIPTYGSWLNPATGRMEGSEPHIEYEFKVCSRNLEMKRSGTETIEYKRWIATDEEPAENEEVIDIKGDRKQVQGTKKQEVNSVYWDMARKYGVEERLTAWSTETERSIAIQGECCGPGIQKNPLGLEEVQFFVYDVYDIDAQRYLPAAERRAILDELNLHYQFDKIQMVPVIDPCFILEPSPKELVEAACNASIAAAGDDERHKLGEGQTPWRYFRARLIEYVVDRILFMADGNTFTGKPLREGLVWKSLRDPHTTFKTISNKFLLKQE